MLKNNLIYNQQKKALQEGLNLFFTGKLGGDKTNDWEHWNQEIGNLCEMLADIIFIEKKNATILTNNRITSVSDIGHKGLDLVAQIGNTYIIGDVKYGASKLADKQMTKDYALGYRLDDAVGEELAKIIRKADKENNVQYILIHFTEEGFSEDSIAVQIYELDDDADIKHDRSGSEIYENLVFEL